MSEVITIEAAALAYDTHRHEGTQARLGGRLKFNFCHWCGRPDGMKSVHRDTLAELSAAVIALTAPWYSAPGNDEYLFYVCPECNRDKIIPDGFVPVTTSILTWAYCDPMAPDYAALAAEPEQVLASLIDRESAGI